MYARLTLSLGFVLVALSTVELTAADNRDRFEARTYTDSAGEKLNYRLLKPKDYDRNKKYPLVLFLHAIALRPGLRDEL